MTRHFILAGFLADAVLLYQRWLFMKYKSGGILFLVPFMWDQGTKEGQGTCPTVPIYGLASSIISSGSKRSRRVSF